MAWRPGIRSWGVPAAIIAGSLLAGTGATYALVGELHRAPPAPPPTRPPATARVQPPAAAPAPTPTPTVSEPSGPTTPGSFPATPPGPSPASSPATSSPRPATELAEIEQISGLLRRSAATRTLVLTTTQAVASCDLAPGIGGARMGRIIASRQELVTSADSLAVTAIPAGARLRSELAAALTLSAAADRGFAAWMQEMKLSGACPGPTSGAAYLTGLQESVLAGLVKSEFLRQWDPLAADFGQPTYTTRQI